MFDSDDGSGLFAVLAGITSPFSAPHYLLEDDFSNAATFAFFPTTGSGLIEKCPILGQTRPLALRLDAEYVATFDRLDIFDAHLLLSTASRFDVAASWNHLEERLPGGGRDKLSLGDCNLVYRFAQTGWGRISHRVGRNWMADSGDANFGLNFNYAADLYPYKPWVVSSELDGGTLGRAGCSVSARPPA